jgi:hypothetical protein
LNSNARDGSASPPAIATAATTTISSRPLISTSVKPTLIFTDSLMPRRLTAVISARRASAVSTTGRSRNTLR